MAAKAGSTQKVLAMSVPDAADAIGISRAQLYVLLKLHEIKSLKIGRRRLIELSEIERFLSDHRVG